MMSKAAPEIESLYSQVHRRMVESGEWDRILRLLAAKLSEHGWSDELCHRAKERARAMDPLSFRAVLEEISPHAQVTVPLAVKREITNLIRQYVREQFEK
ncbi:transcription factor e(y)2-domain-containing protein [Phlebopus sp. FC_14]|nr:transcription factor e(y)2-domain-containing protein [Phlebopus sp. FC_14]